MTEKTSQVVDNPLIIIGDKIAPKPYLTALMQQLRTENSLLDAERQIKYVVCSDSAEIAVALMKNQDAVKMIFIGSGLMGNTMGAARMLSQKARIVIVVDPNIDPLGQDQDTYQRTQKTLEGLGVISVLAHKATEGFFEPLLNEYVLPDQAA